MVFLDLANACVFVPDNVLPEAFDSCRVQVALNAVRTYLKDIQMCFTTTQFTTALQLKLQRYYGRVHYFTLSFHYGTVIINTSKW